MVEETGNNPIVNATKALATHVDKVGEKIQTLIETEKSDNLRKERAGNVEAEKEVKRDQYNRRLQGAEVQLSRDASIIARNSDKQITKLVKTTPKEGNLASDEKQKRTISVLEMLKDGTRNFIESTAGNFEETIGVIRERIKQAFDNNAGLTNFMDAVKGDFSIMLGSLNALQQVPGFNILKTTLFTVGGVLGNQVGKIFNFMMKNGKLTRKQQKSQEAHNRRIEKFGLEGLKLDKKGNIVNNKGFRVLSKEFGQQGKRNKLALLKQEKFNILRSKDMKMGQKTRALFSNLVKRLTLFMSMVSLKFLAIAAAVIAIGVGIFYLYKFIKNNINKIKEFLGINPKSESDAAGIRGETGTGPNIVTEKGALGLIDKGRFTDEELVDRGFSKNFLRKSTFREEILSEVSPSAQLLELLREEGDDLSLEDRLKLDKIITDRLAAGKNFEGRDYTQDELDAIQANRNEFLEAQLQREEAKLLPVEFNPLALYGGVVGGAAEIGRVFGSENRGAVAYNQLISNNTTYSINPGTSEYSKDPVAGTE